MSTRIRVGLATVAAATDRRVGLPLAGQRVRIRLDGILLDVTDKAGDLRRSMCCALTSAACARLRDARPAHHLHRTRTV
jgi:hypothetical protein